MQVRGGEKEKRGWVLPVTKQDYTFFRSRCIVLTMVVCLWSSLAHSARLDALNIQLLEQEQGLQLQWNFDTQFTMPEQIWLNEPQRLVLDFDALRQSDDFALETLPENALLSDLEVIDSGGDLQTVITFVEKANYQIEYTDNQLTIRFYSLDTLPQRAQPAVATWVERTISDLLFSSDKPGQGILKVLYDAKSIPVQYRETAEKMELTFEHSEINDVFLRKYDVTEIFSPVSHFEVTQKKDAVQMDVYFKEPATSLAYQTDAGFFVEFHPKIEEKIDHGPEFQGEKISLNFQNIEVRAVLQLLADFSDFNIVTSDSVSGTLTLRLKSVPWDQALDLILKIKGLDSRREGNVLLVAPTEELAEQERLLLESSQEIEELSPLVSELLQINFAKASELATLLKKDDVTLLSPRGTVSVDERTNNLLIYETPRKLTEIKTLIEKLDRPIRQVLIEAKIIKATDNFEEALGVRFGASAHTVRHGFNNAGLAGNLTGSSTLATSDGSAPQDVSFTDRLSVSLPRTLTDNTGSGSIAFTIARLPLDTILDLEISALESEGLVEIVSSPKLVMANQQTAYIESGEEIPYNETTSSGAASIAFKKAVLRLEVTPQITPDNQVILDLLVNQDSRGASAGGIPAIDKQEMKTQALVQNGETIVLGGIYKQTRQHSATKVPLLGDIPYLGRLFRNEQKVDKREELLIFVTPKVILGTFPDSLREENRLIKPIGSLKEDN